MDTFRSRASNEPTTNQFNKGDLVGWSGTTGSNQVGDPHISLGVSIKYENFSTKSGESLN